MFLWRRICGNCSGDGLRFDVLASAWLPPWCRDSELTHEFNHAGPGADGEWTFYKDTDGNETMTLDEVGELGNHPGKPWFSTYEWHVLHCVYNWRKMFRACTLGTTLELFTTMRCISCIVGRDLVQFSSSSHHHREWSNYKR